MSISRSRNATSFGNSTLAFVSLRRRVLLSSIHQQVVCAPSVVGELEITAGETIADLRVVLVIGSAVLRGQVQITGGTLSPDGRVRISARRKDGGSGPFLSLAILRIDLALTSG